MTAPDYSGTAVTTYIEKGFGEGFWRNSCPVDCGWHGSDWPERGDATACILTERTQHKCLRTPAAPEPQEGERAGG